MTDNSTNNFDEDNTNLAKIREECYQKAYHKVMTDYFMEVKTNVEVISKVDELAKSLFEKVRYPPSITHMNVQYNRELKHKVGTMNIDVNELPKSNDFVDAILYTKHAYWGLTDTIQYKWYNPFFIYKQVAYRSIKHLYVAQDVNGMPNLNLNNPHSHKMHFHFLFYQMPKIKKGTPIMNITDDDFKMYLEWKDKNK